jgi:hypothetical protein
MYGWDPDREEKIKALDDLIAHKILVRRPAQRQFLLMQRDFIAQRREHEIGKLADLLPNTVTYADSTGSAHTQKVAIGDSLAEYYRTREGKKSKYRICFATHLHLAIREKKASPSKVAETERADVGVLVQPLTATAFLTKLKGVVFDFASIYVKAWVTPAALIDRAKGRRNPFYLDVLFVYIATLAIVSSMFLSYLDSFRTQLQLLTNNHRLPVWLAGVEDRIYSVFSLRLLFETFRVVILTGLLSALYTWVFRGKASFREVFNFQGYYVFCWVPLFSWIGLADLKARLIGAPNLLLQILAAIAMIWFLWKYYVCLNKLVGFTWLRGIAPFILYLAVFVWSVNVF